MGASSSFHLRGGWKSTTHALCTALHLCAELVFPFFQQLTTPPTPLHLSLTPWLTPHLCFWMLWRVAAPCPIVTLCNLCRQTPGQLSSQPTVTWILENYLNRDNEYKKWQEDRGWQAEDISRDPVKYRYNDASDSACNSGESVSAGAQRYFWNHAGRRQLFCTK